MRAAVRSVYGASDVLSIAEIDRPVLRPTDVLVRVRAASVNPADVFFLTGEPRMIRLLTGLTRPRSPGVGADFAGEIVEVGAEVTTWSVGDEVFGEGPQGSIAEFARVSQDLVARKPARLDFAATAALPMAAVTALQGLRAANLQPGQSMLVIGASGGVGSMTVQLAADAGAIVTGVCSTANVELVRSLGATTVVDYSREDFVTGDARFDVILDLVGNRSLRDLRYVLAPGGTLVLSSGAGGRWLGPLPRIARAALLSVFTKGTMKSFAATPNHTDLATIAGLVDARRLEPVLDSIHSLDETARAFDIVARGHARGKVVIEP
jgi:NADPH:quinone reductase-like Zn-dependent oxidoreductase